MALDLDDAGNIKTAPLMAFETHAVQGMFAIVRLEYAENEAQFRATSRPALQLTMTPAQLRALGLALQAAAERLESTPKPTSPN